MHKDIVSSVISVDEAIAIADIEPLDSTSYFCGFDIVSLLFLRRSFILDFFFRNYLAFCRWVFCGS
jgi:hypothetical protein